MSEHTKGPWMIERDLDFGNIYIREARGNHGRICRVWNDRTGTEENAVLIAAAPELLQALKLITNQARSWHNFHHGSDIVQCDSICDLLPACDAAIKKAGQ